MAVLREGRARARAARADDRGELRRARSRPTPTARRSSSSPPAGAGPGPELDRDVDALARGLIAAGHRQGRPGRHLGAQLRGVDARPVRHREDRRDPGQRQPGLPHPRVRLRGQPVGHAAADRAPSSSRPATTARWSRRRAHDCPGLERVVYLDTGDWADLRRRPASGRRRRGDRADGGPWRPDDPINIQYTSGTTGYPKGATLSHRNILNNGYLTTELIGFTARGPALHPGALLPLLRHGDGQPRLHHPRRHDGDPGAGLRPRDDAALRSPPSGAPACTACRRCSSRCRTTRPSPTTTSRRCAPGSWPARSARSR